MQPVLLRIGGLAVYAYGTFIGLGLLAGVWVSRREARRLGISRRRISDMWLLGILCALAAWLLRDLLGRVLLGRLQTGFHSGGAVMAAVLPGALVGAWVYARLVRAPPRVLMDAAAPGLALTVAVGRWGCWFNGCCFGRETTSFLGVYAPDLSGVWARRFPTQLLESALCLGIFTLLWRLRRRKPFEGYLTLLLAALYFAARFFLSFLRGDNNYLPGGFSEMQFYSLLIVAGSTAWMSRELGHAKRALDQGA